MKNSSKKLIETAAEVLNRHVASGTASGLLLSGDDRNVALGLVNEILEHAAEGGRLVAAVESNGDLLGFVPRMNVPIPDAALKLVEMPTASPDEP